MTNINNNNKDNDRISNITFGIGLIVIAIFFISFIGKCNYIGTNTSIDADTNIGTSTEEKEKEIIKTVDYNDYYIPFETLVHGQSNIYFDDTRFDRHREIFYLNELQKTSYVIGYLDNTEFANAYRFVRVLANDPDTNVKYVVNTDFIFLLDVPSTINTYAEYKIFHNEYLIAYSKVNDITGLYHIDYIDYSHLESGEDMVYNHRI